MEQKEVQRKTKEKKTIEKSYRKEAQGNPFMGSK